MGKKPPKGRYTNARPGSFGFSLSRPDGTPVNQSSGCLGALVFMIAVGVAITSAGVYGAIQLGAALL